MRRAIVKANRYGSVSKELRIASWLTVLAACVRHMHTRWHRVARNNFLSTAHNQHKFRMQAVSTVDATV